MINNEEKNISRRFTQWKNIALHSKIDYSRLKYFH